MKVFLNPVPIACLLIALAGAAFGSTVTVVLGVVGMVASVGLLSARRAQFQVAQDQTFDLSPESRILLGPVKRLVAEIEKLIENNKESETIRILGAEARTEAGRLLSQVTTSLTTRDDLKKSLRGRYEADKELGKARMKLEFATSAEKAVLESAIAARTMELSHYDEIESFIRRVELGVTQAEAALAEMKAKLALSASGEKAALQPDQDLRETIARMHNLSTSYEEAEQLIRGT
jgi:hypothetical protein